MRGSAGSMGLVPGDRPTAHDSGAKRPVKSWRFADRRELSLEMPTLSMSRLHHHRVPLVTPEKEARGACGVASWQSAHVYQRCGRVTCWPPLRAGGSRRPAPLSRGSSLHHRRSGSPVQEQPRARLRRMVAGVLLLLSWLGLVVLWGTLVEQVLEAAGPQAISLLLADALYADGPLLAWLKYRKGIEALVSLPEDRLLYQDLQKAEGRIDQLERQMGELPLELL